MKRPRPPLLLAIALLLAVVLLIALTPVLVAAGIRGWVWWAARQEGVQVQIAGIDAPLLRPVVLHGVRVRTSAAARFAVDIEIARAEFSLNLSNLFRRAGGRALRDLSISDARAALRKVGVSLPSDSPTSWKPFTHLLADSFRISRLDLRFESDGTRIDARNINLSTSELASGMLDIAEIAVAAPLLSKRFANLRGATSWQNQRLTLGAIEVTRGIDIDAFTIDFAHLRRRRLGFEVKMDVFGGNLRANLSTDARAGRHLWDIAGTASEISLAQMSQTLAWRSPASGLMRTCKFTFRGDTQEMARSTVSIWTELNGFSCAGRTADTIMLGASLYNRRLHLEQLYVKQQKNQLTLSGDAPLSLQAGEWQKPELNADLSATINDLNQFAQLFGARPGEYDGAIVLDGTVGIADRKLRGELTASGNVQMVHARLPGNSHLTAELGCAGSAASVKYANVVREDARLSFWGEADFSNLSSVQATLFPLERLVDVTAAPSGSCVSTMALEPGSATVASPAEITMIKLHGGILAGDWGITVSSRDAAAPEQETTRTFQLCPATTSAVAFTLAGGDRRGF